MKSNGYKENLLKIEDLRDGISKKKNITKQKNK